MLKYELDTLEGISEELQSLYKKDGDIFKLQVEGVVPKTEYDTVNQRAVNAQHEAERRRKTNERLLAEVGAESVEEFDDKLKELQKGKGGNNDEIVAQLKSSYEQKLSEMQSQHKTLLQANAVGQLKEELLKQNIVQAGLDPLSLMAKDRINIDGDKLTILGGDGNPLAGSGSNGYATMADLAKELAASDTGKFFVKDPGQSGGGKPPASSGNPAANNGNLGGTRDERVAALKTRFPGLNQT